MIDKNDISIILPLYEDVDSIKLLIKDIEMLPNFNYRIVIVDDGSRLHPPTQEDFSDIKITNVKDLVTAEKENITFFHSKKYEFLASKTKAAFCITTNNLSQYGAPSWYGDFWRYFESLENSFYTPTPNNLVVYFDILFVEIYN